MPGLDVLAASVSRRGAAQRPRRIAVRAQIVGALTNRLRVVDYAKQHPDVARRADRGAARRHRHVPGRHDTAEPTARPGQRNRALLSWEVADSVPPPTPDNLPQRARGSTRCAPVRRCSPRSTRQIDAVHHEQADEATECIAVIGQDFKSLIWEAMTNVPSYGAWLDGVDQRSAYQYHRSRAAGAAERRRPRPVDAQEPAPRDLARGAHRGLSRRTARAAAPRPGDAVRVGVQSHRRCPRPSPTPITASRSASTGWTS